MRRARRPARSAAIPTSPGSRARPTSRRSIGLQRRLLDRAVALTKPGGRIVYCVCSLEPEEGEQQIEALLAREGGLRRKPVEAGEIGGIAEFVNADGDLRTLPCHWTQSMRDPRMGGLDGFYAARLERNCMASIGLRGYLADPAGLAAQRAISKWYRFCVRSRANL